MERAIKNIKKNICKAHKRWVNNNEKTKKNVKLFNLISTGFHNIMIELLEIL